MPVWHTYGCERFEASSLRLLEAATSLCLHPLPERQRAVAVQIRDGAISLLQLVSEQVKLQALLNEAVFV